MIPFSFHFRQCSEQDTSIKLLTHVGPCLGSIVGNHKTRGQAMGGQLHLDVSCFIALEKLGMKSEAYIPKTLPLAVGATCCQEWDQASHHTCAIRLTVWASLDLILTSLMVLVKSSPFKFRIVALVTGLSYSTRDQSHVRPTRRDRFLIAACGYFGPHFVDIFNLRCNLSHLYVFLTDRYIG